METDEFWELQFINFRISNSCVANPTISQIVLMADTNAWSWISNVSLFRNHLLKGKHNWHILTRFDCFDLVKFERFAVQFWDEHFGRKSSFFDVGGWHRQLWGVLSSGDDLAKAAWFARHVPLLKGLDIVSQWFSPRGSIGFFADIVWKGKRQRLRVTYFVLIENGGQHCNVC